MDAAEDDRDLQVQRASPELLADLQASLPPFLWRTRSLPSGQNNKIRRMVRVKETDRIVALVSPLAHFQGRARRSSELTRLLIAGTLSRAATTT